MFRVTWAVLLGLGLGGVLWGQTGSSASQPPVVLVDGWQLPNGISVCAVPADSTAAFGNLAQYLLNTNSVPGVFFFSNCAQCPGCTLEALGAALGAFINSITYTNGTPVPQVDVIAHSFGGLIVRAYLEGKQLNPGSFSPPSATKIRKAVFIGTPNFGMYQANPSAPASGTLFIQGQPQTNELMPASQFLWDLATWNQFGDDLRGVDALAVIGNAGYYLNGVSQPLYNTTDGMVVTTSASISFAQRNKTRIVPYCHVPAATNSQLAQTFGCAGPGIAYIDSTQHLTWQIISSFLAGTSNWQSIGTSPSNDAYLSKYGGLLVADINNVNQYATPSGVMWGTVTLTPGTSSGYLYYIDLAGGTGTFNFGGATCGPVTAPAGVYLASRCKFGPSIKTVTPLLSGTAKVVQAGTTITIAGSGFGASQCSSCQVTAANPQVTTLQVSSWSNTSIQARLPSSYAGTSTITVSTTAGSDAINIMAATASPAALAINGVVNAATMAQGAIAPGELISIFGTGLGPSTGVSFSVDPNTGMVDTTLAGTSVLVGSTAAPVLYASAAQVNAIVPYEVTGQTAVVQVQYQGASATQSVNVASASPGAFTLDASGTGGVVAANQDGTINGTDSPAAPASYVTIYFTGGGQTSPAGTTGGVNGDTLKYLSNCTATVGGKPATVQFAGAVPGLVDGVDQLNIQLAADTPSGAQPVVITVGGVSSPAGVTLVVQ